MTFKDVEYSSAALLATWQEDPLIEDFEVIEDGKVFIVPINPLDGTFLMDQLVVFEDARLLPISMTGNGPEWAFSQRGAEVYFSKFTDDNTTVETARLSKLSAGWLQTNLVNTRGLGSRLCSQDAEDPAPYLTLGVWYDFEVAGINGWRLDTIPEQQLILNPEQKARRWIPGKNSVLTYRYRLNMGIYDAATQIETFVYSFSYQFIEIFPWSVPEFNGRPAVIAEQQGSAVIVGENVNGDWEEVISFESPDPACPNLFSMEAFSFRGESYVFGVACQQIVEVKPHWIYRTHQTSYIPIKIN